jgi:phosphoglycerate dehydrogenase-like enzyme
MKNKILVITPVKHIKNVASNLETIGDLVTYLNDPSISEVKKIIENYNVIFTNPNKSKVFLGAEIFNCAPNLKIICTASTGTNHIDLVEAKKKGIEVISITKELNVINRISSTAELAMLLTLASVRNLISSYKSVIDGFWDYEPFIGRQLDFLTIGVIGGGRLGSMYINYCKVFGANILLYDPFIKTKIKGINQVNKIQDVFLNSDIISLHVHVNDDTTNLINQEALKLMKEDVIIVNTSRGEIVNEEDLINFLRLHKKAKYATDVISMEVIDKSNNIVLDYAKKSSQIIITPHIGGMTHEAQEIAYNHAISILKNKLSFIK